MGKIFLINYKKVCNENYYLKLKSNCEGPNSEINGGFVFYILCRKLYMIVIFVAVFECLIYQNHNHHLSFASFHKWCSYVPQFSFTSEIKFLAKRPKFEPRGRNMPWFSSKLQSKFNHKILCFHLIFFTPVCNLLSICEGIYLQHFHNKS